MLSHDMNGDQCIILISMVWKNNDETRYDTY